MEHWFPFGNSWFSHLLIFAVVEVAQWNLEIKRLSDVNPGSPAEVKEATLVTTCWESSRLIIIGPEFCLFSFSWIICSKCDCECKINHPWLYLLSVPLWNVHFPYCSYASVWHLGPQKKPTPKHNSVLLKPSGLSVSTNIFYPFFSFFFFPFTFV